jgi:type III restriction enzyme
MLEHYEENVTDYEVKVTKGFQHIHWESFSSSASEQVRDFRAPVQERQAIKRMLFGGFARCLYPNQKFDSDSERRFAVILENDQDVLKWFKPQADVFHIHYGHDSAAYRPDFVVEATDCMYICEPKMASEIDDSVVQEKAQAAATWCEHASEVSDKPWRYLLIPHSAIDDAKTLAALATTYSVKRVQPLPV